MNDILLRRLAWLPTLSLLLTLTACEPDDDDREDAESSMRVKYGETWREFTENPTASFLPDAEPRLVLCGTSDPAPELADDEIRLCIDVALAESIPGSGPATFTLDGTATVPDPASRVDRYFEPGPGHTPGVTGVWASTSCFGTPQDRDAPHQVSGRLELEENSATRLKGRLVLTATGTLGGSCTGNPAEANVPFDLDR